MVRLNKTQQMQPGVYTEQFLGAQSSLVTTVRSSVTGGNRSHWKRLKASGLYFHILTVRKQKRVNRK